MSIADLTVEASGEGERRTLTLSGELDMATAAQLEAAVADELRAPVAELLVDLRLVDFMDSTGLRAVIRARESWQQRGGSFFLLPSQSGEHRQLFQVSGLIGKLTFNEPGDGAAPGLMPKPAEPAGA